MPLLGKKLFTIGAISPQKEAKDLPFLIPHTKERFESKSEYEKKKDLYEQKIWTCRATGHTNLTHEEACISEKTVEKQLSENFPKCFEKEVLEIVHHNTVSLENLVDKAWLKLQQQFVIGEKVSLKVKFADRVIPAKIIAIDSNLTNKEASNSACNSPSSDKENSTDEKDKDSPKKWTPPKMLPYTYSIELENEAKVIHSVPGSDLQRVDKVPCKDVIRHFIRVSALRSGNTATSPWVVNADLVKQYKLINKFADFFLSPVKMSEAFKKAEDNDKKRKSTNCVTKTAAKKLKLDSSVKTKKEKPHKVAEQNKKAQPQASTPSNKKESILSTDAKSASNNKSAKKVSPKKKKVKDSAILITDSDSEDEVALSKLKRSSSAADSDSDVPLYKLVDQTTPKKKKTSQVEVSSDEDVPLSKIATPKKSASSKANSSTTKKKAPSVKAVKNKSEKSAGKNSNKKKSLEAADKKKGGMKQVTLFDLTKKGKTEVKNKAPEQRTPQKKSPAKLPPQPPPTPAIVKRLLNSKRETLPEKMKYSMLLKKAVSVLSLEQIKNLPDKLKGEVEHRKKLLEEKDRMSKMTQEEREAYLKEKREQAKVIQKQKMLQKLRDQRKRFEDTELELTPLPQANLVPTPNGFPNSLFGDVTMVTEFINCYSGLLMPESEYPIYTDALMKALVGGSSGFAYLSRVLTVLLQTLLQDQTAKDYKEFKTQLSDIAVTPFTASELVRLCLQCEDDEDANNGTVPDEYIKLLKDSEFYQLGLEQKICVLQGLCSRVLATYSVQDYMEEQQRQANVLVRQKIEIKQIAAQKKSVKQTGSEAENDKLVEKSDEKSAETKDRNGSFTIKSFYGRDAAAVGNEESDNLLSVVKSRRILAAKAAAEKEKERERMAIREKELEEEKKLRKKQDQIADAINLAKMVLRVESVGTDRHHDRYWIFTNTTPGLYVEKGWMGEEINYTVNKSSSRKTEEDTSESDEEHEANTSLLENMPFNARYKKKRLAIESSVPHPGQNLWFTYRSQKDLNVLLKALHPQGIRESLLKAEIKKRYDDLSKALSRKTSWELRKSNGDDEMVKSFKQELSDMELGLRNGGLGGVKDFDEWESKLLKASEITELGECLIQVKDGILDKFLQGFMKPNPRPAEGEKKQDGEAEDGKSDDESLDKTNKKNIKVGVVVKTGWKEAVENCLTLSRLHVLMALLDACIKWEKSAENAKCKICRKKGNDADLLLCDDCNQAFHMYCLRPALNELPTGDWFCQACKPQRQQFQVSESESEVEEEEKEGACRECGGKEKLIFCSKCPAAFHTQCHDPPMRHPPRGSWECTDCKNGISDRKRKKLSRKVAPKRNYRQGLSASEDEDDYEEDDERKTQTSYGRRSTRSKDKKQETSLSHSRSTSQRESTTPTYRASRRGPSELSLCEDVLQKVMKHKSSWPFLEPVDKKLVPDYYVLIKKPMDFQTMMKKCARLSYASPQEFIEDAALVFENAETYNKPDSEVFHCMKEAEKVFKDTLRKLLPDWPYYRTVVERDENSSGSETGRRQSRNK